MLTKAGGSVFALIRHYPIVFVLLAWAVASVAFLSVGLNTEATLLFRLRLEKWLALNAIGVAIAVATYLFQTLTHSRILTPSIMGLDAIYLFTHLLLISLLGSSGYNQLNAQWVFIINVVVMMLFALLVFGTLILRFSHDMNRLLLLGIVLGLLIQAGNEFLGRLLTPENYAVFQGASFARFDLLNNQSLGLALLLLSICLLIVWRIHPVLDIFRLGRNHVINLGVAYMPTTCLLIMLVAALVSIATALVGPMLFFGLLVVAMTHHLIPEAKSLQALLCASVLGALILVGGQTLFEHVFAMKATLSVVIELVGGIVFIVLLIQRGRHDKGA